MQEILQDFLSEQYSLKFKVDFLDFRKYWIETMFILDGISYKIGFVFTPDMHYTEDFNCNIVKKEIDKHILNIVNKLNIEQYLV